MACRIALAWRARPRRARDVRPSGRPAATRSAHTVRSMPRRAVFVPKQARYAADGCPGPASSAITRMISLKAGWVTVRWRRVRDASMYGMSAFTTT